MYNIAHFIYQMDGKTVLKNGTLPRKMLVYKKELWKKR